MLESSGDQRTCIRIVHVIESASTPLPMTGAGALWLQFCGSQMAGLEMTQLHDKNKM